MGLSRTAGKLLLSSIKTVGKVTTTAILDGIFSKDNIKLLEEVGVFQSKIPIFSVFELTELYKLIKTSISRLGGFTIQIRGISNLLKKSQTEIIIPLILKSDKTKLIEMGKKSNNELKEILESLNDADVFNAPFLALVIKKQQTGNATQPKDLNKFSTPEIAKKMQLLQLQYQLVGRLVVFQNINSIKPLEIPFLNFVVGRNVYKDYSAKGRYLGSSMYELFNTMGRKGQIKTETDKNFSLMIQDIKTILHSLSYQIT